MKGMQPEQEGPVQKEVAAAAQGEVVAQEDSEQTLQVTLRALEKRLSEMQATLRESDAKLGEYVRELEREKQKTVAAEEAKEAVQQTLTAREQELRAALSELVQARADKEKAENQLEILNAAKELGDAAAAAAAAAELQDEEPKEEEKKKKEEPLVDEEHKNEPPLAPIKNSEQETPKPARGMPLPVCCGVLAKVGAAFGLGATIVAGLWKTNIASDLWKSTSFRFEKIVNNFNSTELVSTALGSVNEWFYAQDNKNEKMAVVAAVVMSAAAVAACMVYRCSRANNQEVAEVGVTK